MRMSRACLIVVLLGMPALALGQQQHPHQPDPAECATLPQDLKAVVAAMDASGEKLDALVKRGEMTVLSPALQRLDVALHPTDHVSLTAMPKTEKKAEGQTFAGLLAFSVPRDGDYRVSADTTVWIDVLDGDRALERTKLNRRMQCGHVHKSLGFTLKAGVTYWLQLSGSRGQEARVLITSE